MMMVFEKSLELFVHVPGPLNVGIPLEPTSTLSIELPLCWKSSHGPGALPRSVTQPVESPLMLNRLGLPGSLHVAKSKVFWLSTVSWKLGNSKITCAWKVGDVN